MPTRKQRRRREKDRRHEYEYVYVDDEGHEVEVEPTRRATPRQSPSDGRQADREGSREARAKEPAGARAPRKVTPPSWGRVGRRAAIFAPIMVIVVYYLNRERRDPVRET